MLNNLFSMLKRPLLIFVPPIAIMAGILSAIGIDLKSFEPWGWIFCVSFICLWATELIDKKQKPSNDDRDTISKNIFIIKSEQKLLEYLYQSRSSVVKSADEFLYITGSRSKSFDYLSAIEERLDRRKDIKYIRILFGTPRNNVLIQHLRNLSRFYHENRDIDGICHVQVGYFEKNEKHPERFICCSEKKALILLPSIRTAFGFDTALIIDDENVARSIGDLIQTMVSTADRKCTDHDSLEILIDGWPN